MSTEPVIAVGLVENTRSIEVRLEGTFVDGDGKTIRPGTYHFRCAAQNLACTGPVRREAAEIAWTPVDPERSRFSLPAIIGIDFHWQQEEIQTFQGGLRLVPAGEDRLTAINDVPLETYLTSVICSEMSADAPSAFARAHAVISRSWLLAQLEARNAQGDATPPGDPEPGTRIRWTDRGAHPGFDVCADDHCQRYQGVGRVRSPSVAQAIADTRGLVLTHEGKPCDARFSKCCGGVTEDFRTAWSDEKVPYLVPVLDGPGDLPDPPLTGEAALRDFIEHPSDVYCGSTNDRILARVLNDYDRATRDFFRWRVELDASAAGALIARKLGVDLGRILALEPVARGLSGRIERLRIRGEAGDLVVGKELEIRRALSPTHLYSSSFVVDPAGAAARPDTFVLRGAGWGHGVGLCQIGAAVMAAQGFDHPDILGHYYPGTLLQKLF